MAYPWFDTSRDKRKSNRRRQLTIGRLLFHVSYVNRATIRAKCASEASMLIKRSAAAVGLFLCFGLPTALAADVYKCSKEGGGVNYQSYPCTSDQSSKVVPITPEKPPSYSVPRRSDPVTRRQQTDTRYSARSGNCAAEVQRAVAEKCFQEKSGRVKRCETERLSPECRASLAAGIASKKCSSEYPAVLDSCFASDGDQYTACITSAMPAECSSSSPRSSLRGKEKPETSENQLPVNPRSASCSEEHLRVRSMCERQGREKIQYCEKEHISQACQLQRNSTQQPSEKCRQEYFSAYRCSEDHARDFQQCLLANLSKQCSEPVRSVLDSQKQCETTVARLCETAQGASALHQCTEKHRSEIVAACRNPVLESAKKELDSKTDSKREPRPELLKAWEDYQPFKATTAELAAFQKWHQAVMAGDFATYLTLLPSSDVLGSFSKDLVKKYFDELIKVTPLHLKITPVKDLPTGAKAFTVAGCVFLPSFGKDMRMMANVSVAKKSESFEVNFMGWGPPSNEMADKCPI